jgi:hypothetical protein
MSERAEQLHATAETQIDELIELVGATDNQTLRRPCPGREKLGDGTIGAIAAQTAENYQRIGTFAATSQRTTGRHSSAPRSRRRGPGVLRALKHTPPDHGQHGPDRHGHRDTYTAASIQPGELTERLAAARTDLASIARLTNEQLDDIPPKDSFRFCDGQRTLEQVLAGLLKHQGHQVQTLREALSEAP